MIKRLEAWLTRLFRTELVTHARAVEAAAKHRETAFILAIGEIIAQLAVDLKQHAAESTVAEIKQHVEDGLAKLHENVAADAKLIALYRHTVRLGCSKCGQLTWDYGVNRDSGKVVCKDCREKGA